MRGNQEKYDLDQAKEIVHISHGLRKKHLHNQTIWFDIMHYLCELIGQSVAPESHAHHLLKNIRLCSEWLKNIRFQEERDRENKEEEGESGVVLDLSDGCIAEVCILTRLSGRWSIDMGEISCSCLTFGFKKYGKTS